MELTHRFTVPAPVAETWAAFNDIESVAGCFPGATVTSVEGDEFTGTCKVKLGPIALVYTGSGSFVERDDAAHHAVIEAKGKERAARCWEEDEDFLAKEKIAEWLGGVCVMSLCVVARVY